MKIEHKWKTQQLLFSLSTLALQNVGLGASCQKKCNVIISLPFGSRSNLIVAYF